MAEFVYKVTSSFLNETISRFVKYVELRDDYLIYLFQESFISAQRFNKIA
jgi:hypothetical protein